MDVLHVYLIQNMKTICKGFENMQTIYETNTKQGISIKIPNGIHKPREINTMLENCISFFKLKKIVDQHKTSQQN